MNHLKHALQCKRLDLTMRNTPADSLFSKAIREAQDQQGSGEFIGRLIEREHWKNTLTKEQMDFIQSRDSFYLGTASVEGQPYIQHRGGAKGFVVADSESSLWFPDFSGNRQYISTGNISENSQAFIFFMDYANKRRLKLWGRMKVLPKDAFTLNENQMPVRAKVERIFKFAIDAIDENCRQHITSRYTDEETNFELTKTQQEISQLKLRIQELENNSQKKTVK